MDAQAYGSRNDRRQSEIQHDLPRLLDRAARASGLDRAQWHIQRKGDEQLAVRPVDGQEPRIVDDYVRHLVAELREYNLQRVPEARMRLRAAIHHGLVELADNGFAGAAVVATARLLNAPALYASLDARTEADLVLLLSDGVYRSVVQGGHTTLTSEDFTPVGVRVKDYEDTAWIRVPVLGAHAAAPRDVRAAAPETTTEPTAPGSSADAPSGATAGTGAGGTATGHEYRAEKINVTHVTGSVDARGAVFGFGGSGD
ncbi:hypothetical protein ACIQFU_33245 [Streptomyces sp. NPDC093065]|uniref:hypothetical protein n=1 Tax=Streptomyces sp. NPDC093065 TaxID=3366021 RepID=UPI003823502D